MNKEKELNLEEEKKAITSFLKKQEVMTVSTLNKNGSWCSNFYYILDEDNFKIYHYSVINNRYYNNLFKNNNVSFNIFWYSKKSFLDRISVQGTGSVRQANPEEIKRALLLASDKFPEIEKKISEKVFLGEDGKMIFWVLEPNFIKYLDDSRYKDKEFFDFHF